MQLKSRSFSTQGPQKSLRRERTFGTRIQAAGQWLESSAQLEVPVPLEEAWVLWEDRARIPQWMPWITSVTVFEDNPQLSRWTLSTYQFNQQVGWVVEKRVGWCFFNLSVDLLICYFLQTTVGIQLDSSEFDATTPSENPLEVSPRLLIRIFRVARSSESWAN